VAIEGADSLLFVIPRGSLPIVTWV